MSGAAGDAARVAEAIAALPGGGAGMTLCELYAAGRSFGIDLSAIREVLGVRAVHGVPLAPHYIAGMISYRGEVLAAVSLRSLLGLSARASEGCVLVLDGDVDWKGDVEHFGLVVDQVGSQVAEPEPDAWPDPAEAIAAPRAQEDRTLCCGAFRVRGQRLLQLDPQRLRPGYLAKLQTDCWPRSRACER